MRLFGTDGMRGTVNTFPMTADTALKLGLAAGTLFRSQDSRHKVIIGKDTRLSGYLFESALTAGLCASGMHVYQVGPLPTPALAFLTRNMRADFGIVISASHNQFCDNGIKFFDKNGYKLSDEIEDRMSELVLNSNNSWDYPEADKLGRAYKIVDAPGRYIVYLKNSFPQHLTLSGLRIAIDCAHGANYKVAPLALEELGAEVFKFGTEPNGTNINKNCGSLYPQAIQEKVLELRADIGIALDGDADRVILIDEKGTILDGDQIMAICANDLIKKNELNNNILVSTIMSNMALEVFMNEKKGKLIRTNVGDRYVVQAMREHNATFGGEQSGHLVFHKHSTTGDGLLAALQILRIMKEQEQPLSELANLLTLYPQILVNVKVNKKIDFEKCSSVQSSLKNAEEKLKNKGRVVLRYSGTENLARVMLEGENSQLIKTLANDIAEAVEKDTK